MWEFDSPHSVPLHWHHVLDFSLLPQQSQLLFSAADHLFAIDSGNGKHLWELQLPDSPYAVMPAKDGSLFCKVVQVNSISKLFLRGDVIHHPPVKLEDSFFIVQITAAGKELQRWRLPVQGSVVGGPGTEGEFYMMNSVGTKEDRSDRIYLSRINLR